METSAPHGDRTAARRLADNGILLDTPPDDLMRLRHRRNRDR